MFLGRIVCFPIPGFPFPPLANTTGSEDFNHDSHLRSFVHRPISLSSSQMYHSEDIASCKTLNDIDENHNVIVFLFHRVEVQPDESKGTRQCPLRDCQ